MAKKPWDAKRYRLKAKWDETLHSFTFCGLLLGIWLLHIFALGWFQYFFKPEGYLIKAKHILEDLDQPASRWWNKYHCDLARKAVEFNDPDDYVMFTWRKHPFFLDNEYLYVQSKGLRARVWDHREKIYRFS